MGESTKIEWSDATWNPWRGCDKVSPGCAHCYMFRDQERYGRDPSVVVRAANATFYAPIKKRAWRELPEGSKVFTCSWSDWFHPDADQWRDEAWEIIYERPDLTFQILTKRPERIPGNLPRWWGDADAEAPENIWLGTSIENRRFVHRADQLREIPAAVRFISAEPLLGPLLAQGSRYFTVGDASGMPIDVREPVWADDFDGPDLDLTGIDWLISGGESGPGHRRIEAEWVRDLRDYCLAEGVAFFHKQWGGPRADSNGRLLDGREWSEFPASPGLRREGR